MTGERASSPDGAQRQLFPYCTRCVDHVTAVDRARTVAAALLLVGIALAGVVGFRQDAWHGVVVLAGAFALVLIVGSLLLAGARHRRSASCASVERAVTYLGWNGSTTVFRFTSAVYTARFAESNAALLVDVTPALARLVEGHARAREEVPTPAAPLRVTPQTRAAWSVHFAEQPGPLARRRALRRALAVTYEASERAALISMVAHGELDALLADLEGRSTGARRRRAQLAIDEVSADNLPDELREVLLRELRMLAVAR